MARRGVGLPRLGRARTEAGLSQQALADTVDVHRVTIANIERGSAASLELANDLSAAVGRSLEWLMDEPEKYDRVAQAREALSESLAALEKSACHLADLMDELDGRVRERVAKQGSASFPQSSRFESGSPRPDGDGPAMVGRRGSRPDPSGHLSSATKVPS